MITDAGLDRRARRGGVGWLLAARPDRTLFLAGYEAGCYVDDPVLPCIADLEAQALRIGLEQLSLFTLGRIEDLRPHCNLSPHILPPVRGFVISL